MVTKIQISFITVYAMLSYLETINKESLNVLESSSGSFQIMKIKTSISSLTLS